MKSNVMIIVVQIIMINDIIMTMRTSWQHLVAVFRALVSEETTICPHDFFIVLSTHLSI